MNIISEFLDHNNVKILGISSLIVGYALDAMEKSEYFYIAIFGVCTVVVLTILHILRLRKTYNQETLSIPIVISVESSTSTRNTLKNLFLEIEKKSDFTNLQANLKKYSNIVEDDLIFTYTGDIYDKERLISFLQIIKYQLTKIKKNVPNKVQFHLAYYNKPSIGFLVGSLFDVEDVVIYQQNPDHDAFNDIGHVSKRNYKTEITDYKKFSIDYSINDEISDHILLTIKAASHNIAFNANSLSKYKNKISMHANHQGTIDIEEDWILYAREIFTQLNILQTKYKNITIVHSMPESIAVMVGMGIGSHWNITMTQYDRGEYKELIKLDELKSFF